MHVSSLLDHKQHITAMNLSYLNNWLKEGALQLNFGKYMYPASVETPELAQRNFHPSYPPGAVAQLYLLFKVLDVTGIVPNIYEQRGTQLLLVIIYNYMLHLLLGLTLCWLAFFVCCKLGFDRLNSTLLGVVPAIVLFHNAGNLYWFHLVYAAPTAIVPLFALYIFLELLHIADASPPILRAVRIIQPIIMFLGAFTSWLFIFVILTVYTTRIVRKEIALPISLQKSLSWAKQSFLFAMPSLAAMGIWIHSIAYYQRHVISSNIFEASVSSFGLTFSENLLYKVGILDLYGNPSGIDAFLTYFKKALYTHNSYAYGITAVLMLYAVFYLATRARKFMADKGDSLNLASLTYIMLFVPCLLHSLFLVVDDAEHHFVSLRYSPALSLIFIFAPIFILQMLKKSHLLAAIQLNSGKKITLVALVGIATSTLWAHANIYNKYPITKMFTPPNHHHTMVGKFIKKNTEYSDVVFSNDYYLTGRPFLIDAHFTHKIIHFADNLDHVYHKAKSIHDDFSVKIFYYEKNQKEITNLTIFLKSHNIIVETKREEKAGGLLAFDGKKFIDWYEREHGCDEFPQRCENKG